MRIVPLANTRSTRYGPSRGGANLDLLRVYSGCFNVDIFNIVHGCFSQESSSHENLVLSFGSVGVHTVDVSLLFLHA
jgi:hypothetical protein